MNTEYFCTFFIVFWNGILLITGLTSCAAGESSGLQGPCYSCTVASERTRVKVGAGAHACRQGVHLGLAVAISTTPPLRPLGPMALEPPPKATTSAVFPATSCPPGLVWHKRHCQIFSAKKPGHRQEHRQTRLAQINVCVWTAANW